MTSQTTAPTQDEYLDEASRWNVGAGILTMALFPLALPGIVLVAALALPFLVVAAVGALLAGVVILPLRLIRGLRKRRHAAERPTAERVATSAPSWQLRHREGTL